MSDDPKAAPYELFYWPTIQGRGEMVRLALEDAGVAYVDVARLPPEAGGVPAMLKLMKAESGPAMRPLAPPFLRCGDLVVAQTVAILHWLAPRIGLVPADETARVRALQLQLTLSDLVDESHDVHHPVSTALYFEDQRAEAIKASKTFTGERIPKFLGWLESVLAAAGTPHLAGPFTYVDLSLFWVLRGLRYAFPNAMSRQEKSIPRLRLLHDTVMARPHVADYLVSTRCAPFDENGIFRHYPELDP